LHNLKKEYRLEKKRFKKNYREGARDAKEKTILILGTEVLIPRYVIIENGGVLLKGFSGPAA